ncbi:MAG: tRNA preQ1(34) S-adenosylmethionine ribosyltransferase-isomerase QueA [Nitrospirae bacterium]|nr:tRNA preQ1(34) S-adenosylmethionine ribosyltransferase-isomerase QueA [Nitrospirota bacterium]
MDNYDYKIPPGIIAQYPVDQRDKARLLVLDQKGRIEHRVFYDIVDYLGPGDVIVLNDSKVINARLNAIKEDTGGKVDILLIKDLGNQEWEVMVNKRLKPYQRLLAGKGALIGQFMNENGGKVIRFYGKEVDKKLREIGLPPLPPYIKRNGSGSKSYSGIDRERYQTVYAENEGSLAAPTAGLHFTVSLLNKLRNRGVKIVKITLHIGPITFRPVRVGDISYHRMEHEFYNIPLETADVINSSKKNGERIIAVGTTTARALESATDREGNVIPGSSSTDLFIYPGYNFKVIDVLITNFHLPKSTLLMLVSGLAGIECIKEAYKEAIEKGYRFYSYGDAMLILHSQRRKSV